MAKSGHVLHPAICRSDELELGVVVVACGVTGKLVGKMNIRVRNRNQIEMPPPLGRSSKPAALSGLGIAFGLTLTTPPSGVRSTPGTTGRGACMGVTSSGRHAKTCDMRV